MSSNCHAQIYKSFMHGLFCFCHLTGNNDVSVACKLTDLTYIYIWQKQPPEVFCKKGVLKYFVNFTRKHLCWIKAFRLVPLLKRDSNTAVFL